MSLTKNCCATWHLSPTTFPNSCSVFAKVIFQKYIGGEELVLTVVAKIANAPDINDLHLPFYVETPGLRNGGAIRETAMEPRDATVQL
jgi:hypothetical protein